MAKAVGLDLGTTNSVVAIWEEGKATVIPNSEGSRLTPSVVAYTEDGQSLVGQVARRQAILNPTRPYIRRSGLSVESGARSTKSREWSPTRSSGAQRMRFASRFAGNSSPPKKSPPRSSQTRRGGFQISGRKN